MKLLYTFCLSSAIVLAAACGRTGDAVSENLPDVFPNVLEGGINPNVREVCDDTLKTHILTPPAPAEPRIHGPKVYGERPGRPFQYRIPATGERPMTFSAEGLPHGLKLDASSGIITGKVRRKGTWNATLKAENAKGSDTRPLKIVIGDEIALTPPLGWNSWNCYASGVDQNKIAAAAKAMVDKGLADYGWTYVNIDDAWQGIRGGKYNAIQGNKKFPDIDGLSRYVHAKGLKLGIYSSPWPITYAGHIGSSADNADGTYERIKAGICNDLDRVTRYMNEADSLKFETPERVWRFFGHSFVKNDAAQWADWGIDYLKYDWGPMDPVSAKEMADALIESGRDVVFSISNSAFLGNGPLWKEFVNCWRSTGDIANTWESVSHIGFNLQERWAPYVRPGHWADADMLEVGNGGLTADEEYSHVSLWALLSSPMMIGCDLSKIGDFTLSLLTNGEVLDINQDALGIPATKIEEEKGEFAIYEKNLEDGSVAVGLFNLSSKPRKLGLIPYWLGIYIDGVTVRDLWRQEDVARLNDKWDRWETEVAPHGVVLVRVYPGYTLETERPFRFGLR